MSTPLGRILIVDDEVELTNMLQETLAEQGYETVGFTSARAALREFRERDFDLLLTDLRMPDMDGIDMLKSALDVDPQVVAVLMTGQATVETAVNAMKAGAFDYILKPFELSYLLSVITRAMGVRRLRLENVQLHETLALYELCNAITFTLDFNAILNKVAYSALEQCRADDVSVMLPCGDGKELYVATALGEDRQHLVGQRMPIDKGIAGWVAGNREPLTLEGAVTDSRFAPVKPRPEVRAAISMPMQAGGKLIGILNVSITQARRPFSLGEIKALTILASTSASAIENASLYDQVRELNAELERRVLDRTAQLEAVNKELEAFSYSVSHDLRTPLRAIDSFSRTLLERHSGGPDDDLSSSIDAIRAHTRNMGGLIDDLLAFSRLGRTPITRSEIDMKKLASDVFAQLSSVSSKRVPRFNLQPLPPAYGDPSMVRQVFVNLLSNATKYSKEDEAAMVEVGGYSRNGENVYYVKDNGVGFDMDHANKLFGVFQRLHTAEEFEGTGIGLAIVQRIIDRHGGRVWADGKVNEGAVFYFTLLRENETDGKLSKHE